MIKKIKINKYIVIILLILIFFILAIFPLIEADPPYDLSRYSMGEFTDPGTYGFNARNKVIFNEWFYDNWKPMYLSLIPHVFTYLSFKIFGVSYFYLNLIPLVFSLAILVVFYSIILTIVEN